MTKLFRSKAFLGCICLVLAAVMAFLLLPRFYASQSATVNIVRVNKEVSAGTVITSDMLTTAEVGAYGLPEKVVISENEAIGKVAAETLYAGEMLWQDRLVSAEDYLASEEARTKGLSAGMYLVTLLRHCRCFKSRIHRRCLRMFPEWGFELLRHKMS